MNTLKIGLLMEWKKTIAVKNKFFETVESNECNF